MSTFNGLLDGCRICERRGFDGVGLGYIEDLTISGPTKVILGCVAVFGLANWWDRRSRAKEQKAAQRAEES